MPGAYTQMDDSQSHPSSKKAVSLPHERKINLYGLCGLTAALENGFDDWLSEVHHPTSRLENLFRFIALLSPMLPKCPTSSKVIHNSDSSAAASTVHYRPAENTNISPTRPHLEYIGYEDLGPRGKCLARSLLRLRILFINMAIAGWATNSTPSKPVGVGLPASQKQARVSG